MREGNVFMLSVCLFFECLDIETSFFVWWGILAISRLKDEGQGHFGKLIILTVEHQILLLCPSNDIDMFIKVMVISRS